MRECGCDVGRSKWQREERYLCENCGLKSMTLQLAKTNTHTHTKKKRSLLQIHLKLLHSHPRQYRRTDYITLNGIKESEENKETLLIAYIIKHMVSVSGLVQI